MVIVCWIDKRFLDRTRWNLCLKKMYCFSAQALFIMLLLLLSKLNINTSLHFVRVTFFQHRIYLKRKNFIIFILQLVAQELGLDRI
ncbi:MAG: hypothetical protein D3909_00180 [Candidatus Electrothrix sp. ATG1]|nr:hypothetical protein [Candidatus Electrothrix sp. ATG1]